MYYAVLRKEIKMPCSGGELTLKVGGVYELEKIEAGRWTACGYRLVDVLAIDEGSESGEAYGPWYEMPLDDALNVYFVRYFKDLDSAIEDSFLVCEAAYC